jgi:mannitol/fructose-specific phosphotransferase system IIA component (Ntr-type)
MTLQEKNLIKQLNERVLSQSIVIQTLVDILVEQGVILERELDKRLIKNTEVLNQQIEELHQTEDDSKEQFDFTTYYGPVGEC